MFGIRDSKAREQLLRESGLTLAKTDEICQAAESMVVQMKTIGESANTTVSAITPGKCQSVEDQTKPTTNPRGMCKCWNCVC